MADSIKCQSCNKIFPKTFADRCLKWHGGDEQYTEYELIQAFGTTWKNYDKDGQWYWWKDNFICPKCAQKLIDSGEAEIKTAYYEYYTTCQFDDLQEGIKPFAKAKMCQGKAIGSEVKIPYNVLVKSKTKKKINEKSII